MPTRLLLEGPDIQTLLDQVRAEHGAAARIVSAEKVRSGGLAGFFARQRFELSIEIDDAGPAPVPRASEPPRPGSPRPGSAAAPASVEALVDLAEATESRLGRAVPAATRPPGGAAPAGGAVQQAGGAVRPAAEPAPAAARLAAAPASPATASATAASASTGPLPAPVGPGAAPVGPGAVPAAAALAPPGTETAPSGTQPAPPGAEPAPSGPEPAPAEFARVLAAARSGLGRDPGDGSNGGPAGAGTLSVRRYEPPVVAAPAPLPAALAALGVPDHLAALARGTDRYAAALRAASVLPPAPEPPAAPGDVLVVAGELPVAHLLAGQVARVLQIDPARTLVAGPGAAMVGVPAGRRILGPADAERRGRRLRVADVPHVVVVAAPVDGCSPEWARLVINAVGATAVWALADATRKPADLLRHLRALGRVDALAVHATQASADPATVLGLGVPVAYLDEQPATADAWAALLCARLNEADR